MADLITTAITNYHDLNASTADEIYGQPSPLEFLRYVAKNRPFVARQAANDWTAVAKWDASYLREVVRDEQVKVAVTPFGNADAVVEQADGSLCFVEPCETVEPFGDFLDYVQADSQSKPDGPQRAVKYAQTQNDNLREEYRSLFEDVSDDVDFARIALDRNADAINLWIGNERSVTALHKDNYENVYVQVRGQKHFVLLPPVEMPCVNEQALRRARYKQAGDQLAAVKTEDDESVPVATWDPDEPGVRPSEYSHLSQPLRVTLNEGDMLYLPAMWYHKVSQTSGREGFACAVNYWYDMDFDGSFWTANDFMRDVANSKRREVQYPALELADEQ